MVDPAAALARSMSAHGRRNRSRRRHAIAGRSAGNGRRRRRRRWWRAKHRSAREGQRRHRCGRRGPRRRSEPRQAKDGRPRRTDGRRSPGRSGLQPAGEQRRLLPKSSSKVSFSSPARRRPSRLRARRREPPGHRRLRLVATPARGGRRGSRRNGTPAASALGPALRVPPRRRASAGDGQGVGNRQHRNRAAADRRARRAGGRLLPRRERAGGIVDQHALDSARSQRRAHCAPTAGRVAPPITGGGSALTSTPSR